jgi:hypothetical protein
MDVLAYADDILLRADSTEAKNRQMRILGEFLQWAQKDGARQKCSF